MSQASPAILGGYMAIQVGGTVSLDDVVAVARGETVAIEPAARERMRASRAVVEAKVAAGETVYGVTTGIGTVPRG